ncbi:MAG: hypothetical protein Satyrvirus25_9 [Satyrvirus sp.]|uniref:Uncharacterized protein n=1 Tax=Satyrvirus sp. TaxID=2487771 RepID=A0A3G5AG82_9VIRU|nr:MAG: hypothetical protein Satyrvirus25_9 [Satyrvirus sp.]
MITDTYGVPNNIALAGGSEHDASILKEQINYNLKETDTNKVKNNNSYKQNILGDQKISKITFISTYKNSW